ncbi:hypothetical protein CH300_28075, partial [Rhodococcus sp. 15-1154-1]
MFREKGCVVASRRLPLTAAQWGVWAAEQVTPGADAFRISQLVWLDGGVGAGVDASVLVRAIEWAVSEADVLSLRPVVVDDGGVPALEPAGSVPVPVVVDVAPDEEIRRAAVRRCRELGGGADRFESVSVVHRRVNGGVVWEFSTHHVFVDAYGLGLLTRRVAEVYSALISGVGVPDRWFGEYAGLVDAGDVGSGGAVSGVDDFWVDRFAAAAEAPAVSFDSSRQFFLTDVRARVSLDDEVAAGVDAAARSVRASWADVVTAGWGLFTAARDGRDVVAVRLPQMNRSSRAALTTPAMLVGAAPVVVEVDPSASVSEVVAAVRVQTREGARRQVAGEALARVWPNGPEDYAALSQVNVKAFDYDFSFGGVSGRQETVAGGPAGRLDVMVYRDAVHGFSLDVASSDPALTRESIR